MHSDSIKTQDTDLFALIESSYTLIVQNCYIFPKSQITKFDKWKYMKLLTYFRNSV